MSCPTCGHTMQSVGEVPAVGGDPTFWCPRCGTLDQPARRVTEAPKLVYRCRDLHGIVRADWPMLAATMHRLGIAESIHIPEELPK